MNTATRRPSSFLADLTQAMRVTAEQERQATIEQFRADAKEYVEQLHARSADAGVALRERAEEDVAAIGRWSAEEIERIRRETEKQIADRRESLERQLQDHAAAIDLQVEQIDRRVAGFEAEMSAFFDALLGESDPTAFATKAASMPEPPTLDEPDLAPDVEPGPTAELSLAETPAPEMPAAETAADVPVGDAGEPSNGNGSGALPDGLVTLADAGPNPAEAGSVEPATPAAPAAPAAGRASMAPSAPPAAGPLGQPPVASSRESSQVVVVGLVSVASIATFKRQLGRLPGVTSVGVSSGPDGEFIFTVGHAADTSLSVLVPSLPGFQARVVSERDGVVNVSAHDPEAEG